MATLLMSRAARKQHRLLTSRSHNVISRHRRTHFVNSEVANQFSQLMRDDCGRHNSAHEIFWVLSFLLFTVTPLKYAGILKNKFVSPHFDALYIFKLLTLEFGI
jgi:hypothetical protein